MKPNGDLRLIIKREIAPNVISRKEKDFIIGGIKRQAERRGVQLTDDVLEASCQFPPHRPFFNRILLDDAGRIYVRNARSVLDSNTAVQFDIFSKDGYYLYRVSLPFAPDLVYRGKMYDVYTSQETGQVAPKDLIHQRVKVLFGPEQ